MKHVEYFCVIIMLPLALYSLWNGNEGVAQCLALRDEVIMMEKSLNELKAEISELDRLLSYHKDHEFLAEHAQRNNLLINEGDIVYLI